MGLFSWLFGGGKSKRGGRGGRGGGGQPARIRIDRSEFVLQELGRRSFLAVGDSGWLVPGQRFTFTFLLPGPQGEVEVPGRGRVIKVGQNQLSAAYDDPQPYFRRQIDLYAQSRGR